MQRPSRSRTRDAVLAVLAAAALTVPAAGAQAATAGGARGATVACGRISVKTGGTTVAYSVRIDKGRIGCRLAKRTLRAYLADGASPRGWFCVRGHASQHQRWAAACATAVGTDVKAFRLKG